MAVRISPVVRGAPSDRPRTREPQRAGRIRRSARTTASARRHPLVEGRETLSDADRVTSSICDGGWLPRDAVGAVAKAIAAGWRGRGRSRSSPGARRLRVSAGAVTRGMRPRKGATEGQRARRRGDAPAEPTRNIGGAAIATCPMSRPPTTRPQSTCPPRGKCVRGGPRPAPVALVRRVTRPSTHQTTIAGAAIATCAHQPTARNRRERYSGGTRPYELLDFCQSPMKRSH